MKKLSQAELSGDRNLLFKFFLLSAQYLFVLNNFLILLLMSNTVG